MEEEQVGGPEGSRRLLFIPHTHWDREWYQPFERFRYRLVRLLDQLIEILEADPGYVSFHLDGQAIPLLDYEEIQGRSERLRRLVSAGRIKAGPWLVLPDEFLVSGESLIRNLEAGGKICRELGAEPLPVGYLPDMFGHIAQMPQILAGFGITKAVVWRGITPDVTDPSFIWEAPDGSRVFTVFLPLGYGVFAGPPKHPALLKERVLDLVKYSAAASSFLPLLCGTDHTPPDPEDYRNLTAALQNLSGYSLQFSDLETWLELAAEQGASIVHRGELRAPGRTLILPSVASARLYLKKLNFLAESGLTSYAEPLAALCRALGGPDFQSFLNYAWRLLLENHPHDSMCGCSVDAVHEEMETRFAKAREVSEQVIQESLNLALSRLEGPGLAIYHPSHLPGPVVLTGEVEGRFPPGTCLAAEDGSEHPLQVLETLSPAATLVEAELDRPAALVMLGQNLTTEIAGLYLHHAGVSRSGTVAEVLFELGESPAGLTPADVRQEVEAALADPQIMKIKVRARKLARHRVAVRLPERPGHSVTVFPLRRNKELSGPGVQVGPGLMENEFVRVQFEPGGTCLVTDKISGLGYRCLRVIDVGDRGDAYNFDPVQEDSLLCEPEKVALHALTSGPVAAVMEIRHRFRVPEGLHSNRRSRSRKRVPLDLATSVTLYRSCPRVDFRTSFVNTAADHRLQVAVRLPYEAEEIRVESPFALVPRPIETMRPPPPAGSADLLSQILGREGIYSTSPQRNLTLVRHGAAGLAVMNRGMAEVDAMRLKGATRIALTMVRAVGFLSRGDLVMRPGDAGPPLPAPGAQCLRNFCWEYAVMPFVGEEGEPEAAAQAQAFACPARFSRVVRPAGAFKRLPLFSVANPRVIISAFRPLPANEAELRLVNYSQKPETVTVRPGPWWRNPRPVDLKGDPVTDGPHAAGEDWFRAELRPGEIFTLRFERV